MAVSNNSEYSMSYEKQGYCYDSQSYQKQKKTRLLKKNGATIRIANDSEH